LELRRKEVQAPHTVRLLHPDPLVLSAVRFPLKQGISKDSRKIGLQVATGTVAWCPYALPMKAEDRVPITLRCLGCLAERGMAPGKHLWECFECQGRRVGWSGNEPLEREGR
jgi:hypothetical protein